MTNTNIEEELQNILNEEELALLSKIKQKFEKKISEPPKSIDINDPYAFDDINKIPNLSDSDRELIFYIRGEVSTIDFANNKYLSLNECYNQNYHISIPSGISYEETMKEFVLGFEQHLSILGNKVHKLKNE